MDPTSEMEAIRQQIRAAFARSPDKSQKELAKLLNISATQVTSLLKPGGRRLQAAEVPIVERYLGITLLKREASAVASRRLRVARVETRPPLPPMNFAAEGVTVPVSDLPADIARYLESVSAERAAEVWRITTDRVQEAGYLPGDYVVIDRGHPPSAGDVVLAEVREKAGWWIPIFRVYAPPVLRTANSKYVREPALPADGTSIAVIGPIIGSVRAPRSP
jgi:SOS-response transcriptional repressor LexA